MMRDPAGSGNVLANLVDEGGDGGMAHRPGAHELFEFRALPRPRRVGVRNLLM
jgi:hypothetical protein